MSIDETLSANQSKEKKEDEVGPWPKLFVLSGGFWWVVAYFLVGPYLSLPWYYRDLLASGPLILLSLTAPPYIRRLAIWGTIWWLIAHLTHDFVFTYIHPQMDSTFPTLLLLWLLSWVPAALAGVAFVAACLLPPAYFASEFVLAFRGVFGLTQWEAIRALLQVGFGVQHPYRIFEDGKETISKPYGLLKKIGGPGLVIVRPANAVAFERLGKVTQIVGPGRTFTKLFEFPKQIVQLRPRWINFDADNVMTKDGVSLTLKGGIGAQIEPYEETRRRLEEARRKGQAYEWAWRNAQCRDVIMGEFPVYKDSVFRAIYLPAGPDWETTLSGATATFVREMLGRRRLEDIYGDPAEGMDGGNDTIISAIEHEVRDRLNGFVREWGIRISGVRIIVLSPPPEVQERVRRRWTTAAERINMEQLGEAEAETLKVIEATKKNSFEEMSRSLQTAIQRLTRSVGEEQTLRFQDVLQTIAVNVGRDSTATLRYIEALEKLSEHPGARIIIAPGGKGINIEEHE